MKNVRGSDFLVFFPNIVQQQLADYRYFPSNKQAVCSLPLLETHKSWKLYLNKYFLDLLTCIPEDTN